jgi:hypothetical protein
MPEPAKAFRGLRSCRADNQYEGSDGRSHHNADLKTMSFHNIFSPPLQIPVKKFQEISRKAAKKIRRRWVAAF